MQINGEQIPDDELCAITEEIKPLADSAFSSSPPSLRWSRRIAFAWFARRQCDIVVCEVGMGGEFDATNVILRAGGCRACATSALTTRRCWATRWRRSPPPRAGIIKPGCDAVHVPLHRRRWRPWSKQRCREVGAALHKADFTDAAPAAVITIWTGQVFDCGALPRAEAAAAGRASAAQCSRCAHRGWTVHAAARLEPYGRATSARDCASRHAGRAGFRSCGAKTRCSSSTADTIRSAFRRSSRTFTDYLADRPLTILTGVLADKDYHCMYRNVAALRKGVHHRHPGQSPRAERRTIWRNTCRQFGKPVTACDAVADGVRLAVEHAGKDGVVLCYGSLYMIGEIEAGLQQL